MEDYPFNGHDGGANHHVVKQLEFARLHTA